MIAQECAAPSYAALWERTRDCLAPLGLTETPLRPEWAATTGAAGQVRLNAAAWRVGPPDAPVGECRVARLQGAADGLLALIGPLQPGHLPILRAELFAVQGRPQLAWLDILAPGMSVTVRDEVAEQTTVLSIRHALFLPRDEQMPPWAVEESPGGFLFTRTNRPESLPRLAQAFEDYLNIWLDFAFALPSPPTARAAAAFRPSRAGRESWLQRFFGDVWTERFLTEFWYR